MGETIIKILVTIALAGIVIWLLPTTPFTAILNNMDEIPYIAQINWFVPFRRLEGITAVWAIACASYWCVSWILRQLDLIGA